MRLERFDTKNWDRSSVVAKTLAMSYASDFWTGAWRELLAIRVDGKVIRQWGANSKDGIYPDTQEILEKYEVDTQDPSWPTRLWKLASEGSLFDDENRKIEPYWPIDTALDELEKFVNPLNHGGCGGEILVLYDDHHNIAGMTSYAVHKGLDGRLSADRRFPVEQIRLIETNEVVQTTVGQELLKRFHKDATIGVFLDHAISERFRGQGAGSYLFDARITRMQELKAGVFFGKTVLRSPAQYFGCYIARGLKPFASDFSDHEKHYFLCRDSEIKERKSK